jgi:cyanophycin synthetase
VVKPAAGSSSGLGVTTGVRRRRQLLAALALASLYDGRILIERMVPGESYRLLYLDARLIHAVRRRGIRVSGDGRRPVVELLRTEGHAALEHDATTRETLAAQGMTLQTVPPPDAAVLVRGLPPGARTTRELRTVYDDSVLPLCGAGLIRDGAEIVKGLGSELAGVDLITTNPAVSLQASGGKFIEINTTPGLHHHYITEEDRTKAPVAVEVLAHLLACHRWA